MNESTRLRLLLNVALLGDVTPNMRAALIRKVGSEIKTRFVFYIRPSDDELESASIASTEVVADFNQNEIISENYEVNANENIVCGEGEELVYRRKD